MRSLRHGLFLASLCALGLPFTACTGTMAGDDSSDGTLSDGGAPSDARQQSGDAGPTVGEDAGEADAGPETYVDPTLSTAPEDVSRAEAYEAQLWAIRDDFVAQIMGTFGDRRLSDDDARAASYSSGWGHAAYHSMDEIAALTHVMEATGDETHRDFYAEAARDILDILVPAIAEGRGTEGCPAEAGLYQCSQGYFRYLDAGHGSGAAGFVMNAFWENPVLRERYAADLDRWAGLLAPTLDRHAAITEPTDPSPHPHMPAKIAAGFLAVGKVLDRPAYIDAFERVARVLVASAETHEIDGWVGSDVGHAEISTLVMHLAYREQIRGTIAVHVMPAHLTGVGQAFEEARDRYTASGTRDTDWVHHHGTLVRFSDRIAALASPTYDLSGRSFGWAYGTIVSTIAALAIGHVTPLEP